MAGAYFILGFLGLVAIGLVGSVIAEEVSERRKALAAARFVGQYQRSELEQGR